MFFAVEISLTNTSSFKSAAWNIRQNSIEGPTSLADQTSEVSPAMWQYENMTIMRLMHTEHIYSCEWVAD